MNDGILFKYIQDSRNSPMETELIMIAERTTCLPSTDQVGRPELGFEYQALLLFDIMVQIWIDGY